MTNGVHLEGHVMVPNLGYKKDAFLELSLISNFLLDTTLPLPPQLCLLLAVLTPLLSSSTGSAAWLNSFLREGTQLLQEFRTP